MNPNKQTLLEAIELSGQMAETMGPEWQSSFTSEFRPYHAAIRFGPVHIHEDYLAVKHFGQMRYIASVCPKDPNHEGEHVPRSVPILGYGLTPEEALRELAVKVAAWTSAFIEFNDRVRELLPEPEENE